jgi:hypothetical protein
MKANDPLAPSPVDPAHDRLDQMIGRRDRRDRLQQGCKSRFPGRDRRIEIGLAPTACRHGRSLRRIEGAEEILAGKTVNIVEFSHRSGIP